MTFIRRVLAVGLFVSLLAVGWSFAAGNEQAVSVDYLLGTTEPIPLWGVVGAAWGLGVALAGGYLGLALLKDRVEIRRLHRAIRGLEGELRDFRNKPLDRAMRADGDAALEQALRGESASVGAPASRAGAGGG